MHISSASSAGSVISSAYTGSNDIIELQKEHAKLEQQINLENQSQGDAKTKQQKIAQLRQQIQQIDQQIAQKRLEKSQQAASSTNGSNDNSSQATVSSSTLNVTA